MSSPINRPLGGRYGDLAKMGVTITPDADPADVGWTFTGPIAISNDVALTGEATLDGKELSRVHQAAMAAVGTAGGIFAFQNPHAVPILVLRAILEWTTVSSGACTVDVGVAANGTTLSDTLIDGQSVATTAGLVSSTVPRRVDANGGTSDWVTASVASGTVTGLAGRVYVEYIPIQ